MAGENDLSRLLATMQPVLQAGEYVFCTTHSPPAIPAEMVLGSFREPEGLTLIMAREAADTYGLPYEHIMAWLTLTVHSSLVAVGLTAAVAAALGQENISCNMVAAYYHDHVFVAMADAVRAVETLRALSLKAAAALQ
ncbi:ACT domain-containing protein [Hymenobacter negativus]|uniref:ACT domain-containing protein n=1 Tax=Hymenobacter negativus TaxID=2795026 RepID=A0ABS3QEL6_9BACT|nr:ACT domain-containing protein [Hymenobacter negativus]MBO2009428.1 ACT domain-containing protein [Hymenobacter negativus]